MALALELPYILINYMCAGGLALVHTYVRKTEWNRMDASANSNVMPTLRGFRWYPYFGAQE